MILTELQPHITMATMEEEEILAVQDLTNDLLPYLDTMDESDFFDEMDDRAPEARRRMPAFAEFMGRVASHEGPRVAIVDFSPQSVAGVRPTPLQHLERGEQNLFAPDMYRGLTVGMANWYGYGYTTQQHAAIHNNIVQVRELADVAGHSASAPHELGLHVEDASYNAGEGRDISPDFLTLHYYRNPTGVPTVVSMPQWDQLSTETRDLLAEEWFFNRTNPAQGGSQNNQTKPVSITYGGSSQDPWIRLNTAKLDLEAYGAKEQAALVELRDHLEERRIDLALHAGQIAIIDNRRVLHGRPAFRPGQEPKYDGTDRWQRRLVVANDVDRIQRHEARYRIVDPESVVR